MAGGGLFLSAGGTDCSIPLGATGRSRADYQDRLASWERYHELLEPLEAKGILRRPIIPEGCQHNAHMYYVLLAPEIDRQKVLDELKRNEIDSIFHYVPLHSSPAGQRYGRVHGLSGCDHRSIERLVRLPLWLGLTEQQQVKVVDVLKTAVNLKLDKKLSGLMGPL